MEDFEPRIIAFCCNWCAYTGADLAGVTRVQYPPNIRIIRVMCSGSIDPAYIMRAFMMGADGVLVLGCPPSHCHYLNGNYVAKRRLALLNNLLEYFGIEKKRVQSFFQHWVSVAEGEGFSQVIKEVTEEVRALGPAKRYADSGQCEQGK